MRKVNNLNQRTLLITLTLGLVFLACEKQNLQIDGAELDRQLETDFLGDDSDLSQALTAPEWIPDDRNYNAIATFGEINGMIGRIITNQNTTNGEFAVGKELISSFEEYSTDKAAYVYVDLDKLAYDHKPFKDFFQDAEEAKASLILESSSNNPKSFEQLGIFSSGENPVSLVVIEFSKNSQGVLVTPYLSDFDEMSKAMIVSNLFAKHNRTPKMSLRSSSLPSPTFEEDYPDKKCVKMSKGRVRCTNGTKLIKAKNGFKTYNNSSRYTYEYRDVERKITTASLYGGLSPEKTDIIHEMAVIDAYADVEGVLKLDCGITAGGSKTESYEKDYSKKINITFSDKVLGSFVKSVLPGLTFSVDEKIGEKKVKGTTTSISAVGWPKTMGKRYAQPRVRQDVFNLNKGYFEGEVEYTIYRRDNKSPKRLFKKIARVEATFEGISTANEWRGMQPLKERRAVLQMYYFGDLLNGDSCD